MIRCLADFSKYHEDSETRHMKLAWLNLFSAHYPGRSSSLSFTERVAVSLLVRESQSSWG